jgi:hypothetical protein
MSAISSSESRSEYSLESSIFELHSFMTPLNPAVFFRTCPAIPNLFKMSGAHAFGIGDIS